MKYEYFSKQILKSNFLETTKIIYVGDSLTKKVYYLIYLGACNKALENKRAF